MDKKDKHRQSPVKEGFDNEEKETKKKIALAKGPSIVQSQTQASKNSRDRCILMTTTAYRAIKTDDQAATDVTPPPLPPYQELVNYPQYLSDSKAG